MPAAVAVAVPVEVVLAQRRHRRPRRAVRGRQHVAAVDQRASALEAVRSLRLPARNTGLDNSSFVYLQGNKSGLRQHFVDFDLNVPVSACFCFGSSKSG